MTKTNSSNSIGIHAKIGAWLFVLWGVLHIWVGAEGIRQYLTAGTPSLWNMLIGGHAVPRLAFQHSTDAVTAFAHGQLLLNFTLDVGGYGVLGFFVAWLILKVAPWPGYLIGVFVIGIADLAFLFSQVVAGVIELNAGTIGGPVLWFLAIIITPFGLPKLTKAYN